MIIPNIWENKIDVPNHQPENIMKYAAPMIFQSLWREETRLDTDGNKEYVPCQLKTWQVWRSSRLAKNSFRCHGNPQITIETRIMRYCNMDVADIHNSENLINQ